MAFFSDEERKKIEEEAEIRARVYLKYEKKSPGAAGVLSSVCPGLGQIYNGQVGKASLFIFVILVSLLILSMGVFFQIKGMPTKKSPVAIEEPKSVEMNDEGVIVEPEEEKEQGEKTEKTDNKKPATPAVLIIVGIIGTMAGWNYSVKDAIKTAKRINLSY